MVRYLRLLGVFWKSTVLYELEYRANFVVNTLVSLAWLGWSLAGVWVFFLHRDRIGDWTYYQAMVVLALFLLFNGVLGAFMRPNVEELMEHIRTGTLDFLLTKPVNSQFHATLRQLAVWNFPDLLIGLAVLIYALMQLGVQPSLAQVVLFVVLLLAATLMLYSLVLMLVTSAFWFVQVNNILELLFAFYETGRFPVAVYPQWLRAVLTFIVPIAFITTVPAEVVLDRLVDPRLVAYALGMALVLFVGSGWFWRYAVRRYSSASS